MSALTNLPHIPAMTKAQVDKVRILESIAQKHPQFNIPVEHFLHGGMYVRTVKIPAGVVITGVLIRLETTIIISGDAMIHTGEKWIERKGYNVLPAAAGRKQIFVALTDVNLTMFFPTKAKTVKDAEEQFTTEADLLQNRGAECQV
jgi:hypothetical protein